MQTLMQIRVSAGNTPFSSPTRTCLLKDVKNLTIWNRGEHVDGQVIGNVLNQCCRCGSASPNDDNDDDESPTIITTTTTSELTSITIERRDNDWDSPHTRLRLKEEDDWNLAASLNLHNCQNLQSFTLTGLVPTATKHGGKSSAFYLSAIVQALVALPILKTIKIGADLSTMSRATSSSLWASTTGEPSSSSYFTHHDLRQLLRMKSLQSLSLLGLFPESTDYRKVFQEEYINFGCQVHIFVYFNNKNAGTTDMTSVSTTTKKPSRFSYYIREIMELNQLGRVHVRDTNNANELLELLVHANGNRRRSNMKRRTAEQDTTANRKNNNNNSKKKATKPSFLSSLLQPNPVRRPSAVPPSLDSLFVLIRENPWICDCIINDDNDTRNSGERNNKSNERKKPNSKKRGSLFSRFRKS